MTGGAVAAGTGAGAGTAAAFSDAIEAFFVGEEGGVVILAPVSLAAFLLGEAVSSVRRAAGVGEVFEGEDDALGISISI